MLAVLKPELAAPPQFGSQHSKKKPAIAFRDRPRSKLVSIAITQTAALSAVTTSPFLSVSRITDRPLLWIDSSN
jgi:hypothetical protein